MTDVLAEWLALREPVDAISRSAGLTRAMTGLLIAAKPVRVLDLATGTGSNLRYLADRLQGDQHWLVVDRNPALLAELPDRTAAWGETVGYEVARNATGFVMTGKGLNCRVDMRLRDLETLDADLFAGRHLVTASALLDLVSPSWLRALAVRCREVGAAALFAITYNGRSSCAPVGAQDEIILDLFNQHQRRDKGLGGAAAGPDGAMAAARAFEEAGYTARMEPSDWKLGPGEAELQRQLIDGWAAAATEVAPAETATIERWRARRIQLVTDRRSRVVVGHHDVGAWL